MRTLATALLWIGIGLGANAQQAPLPIATVGNDLILQQAPVQFAPATYGTVTLALGQSNAVLTQGCAPCAVKLPANPPDGYTQIVTALTPPGGNGTVPQGTGSALFFPAAGQSISDGYTATPGPMPIAGTQWTLKWAVATSTWTLNGAGAVQPALSLDFINGLYGYSYPGGTASAASTTLASLLAVTNAGPATYMDAGGIVRDAPANTPRITHDPKAPNYPAVGLLVEANARNLVTGSNNGLTTSTPAGPWVATPGGGNWPVVVGSTGIAGCPVLYQGAINSGVVLQGGYESGDSWMGHLTVQGTAGNTDTASIAVCIPDSFGNTHPNSVTVCPTLTESPATSTQIAQRCADITLRNQWQWLSVTVSITATGAKDFILRQTNATAGDVLFYSLPQVEVNPAQTSYVPNAAGQANTRPADVVTLNASATLDMLNGGTLLADAVVPVPNASAALNGQVAVTDPTAAYQEQIGFGGSATLPVVQAASLSGGAQAAALSGDLLAPGLGARVALAFNDHLTELTSSLGGTANTSQFALPPNMDALTITPGTSLALRQIAYYPASIPHQALVSLVNTSGPWPVAVNSSAPGYTIPLDFQGPSFELSYGNNTVPIGSNAGLAAIYQVLGGRCGGRVGGITGDTSSQPLASRVQSWVSFFHQIGCQSIHWGLNYNLTPAQNAATAVTLAAAAAAQTPPVMVKFGIGNEPDNYGVSFATYQANWYAIQQAVAAAVPGAVFYGSDTTDLSTSWNRQFATSTSPALGSLIAELAAHHYANGVQYFQRQDATGLLWGDNRLDLLARSMPPIAQLAGLAATGTVRMTETGSMGGPPSTIGLTLAGAVWDVWEELALAANGWAGLNFHGGDSGSYSPVAANGDGTYRAQAALYAMALFTPLLGGQVLPVTAQLPAHISVLGVLGADGKTRVLLVNRSSTQSAVLNLGSTGTWSAASVLVLTGPGYLSQQMTIGGAQITSSGGLAAVPFVVGKNGAGVAPTVVPPSSAALVTLS